MNPDDQIPAGILRIPRTLTDTEFETFKARFAAAYGTTFTEMHGEGQPSPIVVEMVAATSLFLRSACCDAAVHQIEDFAADCRPVQCARCGRLAGSPGREDVDALVGGP